jgi:hypothetical protein
MRAKIDPIRQARIARLKFRQGLVPAARKTALFPDFIEAARVAAVAQQDVFAAYPEPAGDPNVDGILLRQRAPRGGRRAAIEQIAHLTAEQHPALIADESSKLMAAPGRSRETTT